MVTDYQNPNTNTISLSSLEKNLDKYIDLISYLRWTPDAYLDLIKPKEGGIHLHSDQRLFLRVMSRFFSIYGCYPRGFSKTYLEMLEYMTTATFYPNIDLSITAQTKESSAEFIKDKYNEIVRHFPMFENEIKKKTFQRGVAEIHFKSGSIIDNLANHRNSLGQRRKRIHIEESALLNNELFDEVMKPIVEVPRYTCGKLAVVNPEELNQQIHFFSTPGYKSSDEHSRNLHMIKNMVELKGYYVTGADWMLSCWYGRGSSKSQILEKKKTMSPIAFAQNYGGEWTGASSGALVNINRLLDCRVLESPVWESNNDKDEFYIGVDVARSQNTNNNQSSAVVGKVNRNPATDRIISIDIVNVFNISNILNFDDQAIIVKKIANRYKPKMVIVDGNIIGSGLVDALLREAFDPITKEPLGCWDTINTDNKPESEYAEKCLFDLKAQGINTKIITTFMDYVDSGRLRLLEKRQDNEFTDKEKNDFEKNVLPFYQTDLLVEEISNLKIKYVGNSQLSVEKIVRKIDKDRYSGLAYLIYYVNEYCSQSRRRKESNIDVTQFSFRAPLIKKNIQNI